MLQFTEKELKLIWLMMDRAAAQGEVDNAARMLVQSLRTRNVSAQEIEKAVSRVSNAWDFPPRAPKHKPDYGLCIMPWGKHKGKQFKDIAPSYFRYIVQWIEDPDGDRLPDMAGLLADIKAWLAQG